MPLVSYYVSMKLAEVLDQPDGHFDLVRLLESDAYDQVQQHIADGLLPDDTMLRLDSLGDNTPLPDDRQTAVARSFRWSLIIQLAEFGDDLSRLSPLARNVVFGERPKVMLCWNPEADADRLHAYDPPFFIREDMAEIIRERRVLQGKTITEVPEDRRWRPPEHIELMQCYRLSHGIWRVLANRIVPEFLRAEDLRNYYRPRKTNVRIGNEYGINFSEGADDLIVRREIISSIAFNVEHIRAIYDEACTDGVRGIGPVGRSDLRTLLAEEYPELQ